MSSPNHPTSNIEDAFSSNFLDYLLASPDYVPASPGKTYSSSSNSFGVVPIASPTLLMPPKRNSASAASASEALAMTQAAIRNRKPREAPVARKCSYKEFMSCQPFNFKGSKGAIGLIHWFEHTESVFSRSNCTEDCKELATLCPTMVSDSEKLLEAFIEEIPRSIEGNVTASKRQTLEEAINIA
nr:reverse transcriptase domain-containing protein [Tanacetum cinerariifolium]